ncbi:glutathione S-transferase N-terminal domain-containing protein [Myxococcota bacterium]|nr:glutathione S-transferase N-terminal domain-containing protein [Myxococcota bacterium]
MKRVEIYTRAFCVWCLRAKMTLRLRGVPFEEHDASTDEVRAWLVERTGRKTVPQIFVDGRSIGGSDDLAALVKSGELDRLLAEV